MTMIMVVRLGWMGVCGDGGGGSSGGDGAVVAVAVMVVVAVAASQLSYHLLQTLPVSSKALTNPSKAFPTPYHAFPAPLQALLTPFLSSLSSLASPPNFIIGLPCFRGPRPYNAPSRDGLCSLIAPYSSLGDYPTTVVVAVIVPCGVTAPSLLH